MATVAERASSPDAFAVLVKAYTGRGNALIGLKQYEAAVDDFRKVLDTDPNNVLALIGRGKAVFQMGNLGPRLLLLPNAALLRCLGRS